MSDEEKVSYPKTFNRKFAVALAGMAASVAVITSGCSTDKPLDELTLGDIKNEASGAYDSASDFVKSEDFLKYKDIAVDGICSLGSTYAQLDGPKREVANQLIRQFASTYSEEGGDAGAIADDLARAVDSGNEISTDALNSALENCN